MSLFRKKTKPDGESPPFKIIRFAIEDSFIVPEDTKEAVIEAMIARIAKKHNFIWTDEEEGSLFDFGDEE